MKASGILSLACMAGLFLALTGPARGEDERKIKTSYKQYSVIAYQGRDVLCEPYVVRKNDWLYKIFRQKGEISEPDFPFFISIFKQINPHIRNVDAIETGTRIFIPLKIADKQDYAVDKDGKVKIPVVEFHHTYRIDPDNRTKIPIPPGPDISNRHEPAGALSHPAHPIPEPLIPEIHLSRKQIFQILKQSGFDYEPDKVIGFHVNRIPVSARLDRVKIPNRPDLLLNFGTVFGQGIESIQQMGFNLLTFPLKQGWQEQVHHLLSALGFDVWHQPCFSHQGTVETLPGIYGEHASNRLLVAGTPVTPIIQSFLEARHIKYVYLQP
jgi:hypothetical protein